MQFIISTLADELSQFDEEIVSWTYLGNLNNFDKPFVKIQFYKGENTKQLSMFTIYKSYFDPCSKMHDRFYVRSRHYIQIVAGIFYNICKNIEPTIKLNVGSNVELNDTINVICLRNIANYGIVISYGMPPQNITNPKNKHPHKFISNNNLDKFDEIFTNVIDDYYNDTSDTMIILHY